MRQGRTTMRSLLSLRSLLSSRSLLL